MLFKKNEIKIEPELEKIYFEFEMTFAKKYINYIIM